MRERSEGKPSRLGSNIAWNFGSGLASVFGLLLLYPLAVSVAGAEAYGIWVLAFGAIQLFTLADFGLGTGIVRTLSKLHHAKTNDSERREFIAVAGLLFTVLATVLALGCFLLFPWYLKTVPMSSELRMLVPLIASIASASLFLSVIGRFFNSVLWAEDRPDIERKAALVALLLRALLLIFALRADYGIVAVVVIEATSVVLPGLVCAFAVVRRYGKPRFRRTAFSNYSGPLLRVSGVLFIGTFASVAASQIPLYIVGSALGLSATTAFGAVLRIFQSAKLTISWVTNPFTHALASQEPSRGTPRKTARKCYQLALGASLALALPLAVLPGEIVSVWLGEGFSFISSSLIVVAISTLAHAIILPSALVTNLRADPWPTSLLGVAVLILTVVGVTNGTQFESLQGAVVGLVAPLVITAPLYFLFAHRAVRLTLNARQFRAASLVTVGWLLLAAGFYFISKLIPPLQTLVFYGVVMVALVGILLFVRSKGLAIRI